MSKPFKKFIKLIENKRVVIWGLGLNRGGLGATLFFAKSKARVIVVDQKPEKDLKKSIEVLRRFSNVKFVFGNQDEKNFKNADLIIKNQAIPWEHPLVKKLLNRGVAIETDITLFFRFFKGEIVGVTGSKGKTTTTILIGKFLSKSGKEVLLGGNIRVSLFDFFSSKILNDKNKVAVLELSSFQLEDLNFIRRSPHVVVITNIYRDHLNRYGTLKKYIEAKKPICMFQKGRDFLVLNREDKKAGEFKNCSIAKAGWFSSKYFAIPALAFQKDKGAGTHVSGEPKHTGSPAKPENHNSKLRISVKNPVLLSKNNQANLSAALAVAGGIFRIKRSVLEKVINNFKGVPYRMEKIAVIKNVTFYNDTAATIPDAAIGGINSFNGLNPMVGSCPSRRAGSPEEDNKRKKTILISGGADKNLKFAKFAKTIAKKIKRVILLPGTATPLIVSALKKYAPRVPRREVKSMDSAVKTAYKEAAPGDTILLSPGCASFGLFKNEFDRGDQFNVAVRKLK